MARRLREATQCWLAGFESLAPLLAPHEQGWLAPWAVQLADDWLTVAQARPGVLDEDLVAWDGLASLPQPLTRFRDRTSFTAPYGRLACWERARSQLRPALTNLMRQRTLPVPPTSPLAAERAWFLARQIMAKGRPSRVGQHILLNDLQPELDVLMTQAANTAWSSWQWAPATRSTLTTSVGSARTCSTCRGTGSPAPGLPPTGCTPAPLLLAGLLPELTRSITADVLRDALTGYRDLVELNFPRFGAALGLYSILPVRAEGVVALSPTSRSPPWSCTPCAPIRRPLRTSGQSWI